MLENPENKNFAHAAYQHLRDSTRTAQIAVVTGATSLMLAMNAHPLDSADPRDSFGTANAEAHKPATATPKKPKESASNGKEGCTSIRTRPDYVYMGWACAENGDTYMPIGYRDKGWVYSAVRIAMKGIDTIKCGYVREDVLSTGPTRPRAVTHCKNYYQDLVRKRDVFFTQYNCGDTGVDPCKDATAFSRKSERCEDPSTFRNNDTDEPSPLNVYGTGQGKLHGYMEDNKTTSFQYRTKFTQRTHGDTVGMVVRAPEWGWGNNKCVDPKDRDGGALTPEAKAKL